MDVIGRAIDDERRAAEFADNTPEVGEETIFASRERLREGVPWC
jgi:hypothetical protein